MDMQRLQHRSFASQFSLHACFRPVQAGCSVVGSVRPQSKARHVLVSRCSATSGSDSAPLRSNVGRTFQQHKLLMEAGFSYDQASLILEITERRTAPQPAVAGTCSESRSAEAPQPAATAAAADHSTNTTNTDSTSSSMSAGRAERQQRQRHQQPGLKGVEARLSFLELELLKLTLQPGAQQQLVQDPTAGNAAGPSVPPGAAATSRGLDPAAAAAAAAGYRGHGPWGWPGYDAADRPDSMLGHGLISQPELLDPEVWAIAEALLIRKGLPYSAAAFAAPPGVAGWQGQFQQQQQQQQGRPRAPSSVWGRRRAAQQLQAKPWRYSDDSAAAASKQGPMPFGYQHNHDASLIRSRGASSSSSIGRSGGAGKAAPDDVAGPDGYFGNYPAGYGSGYDPRYGPGYPEGYDPRYDSLMRPEGGLAGDDLAPYEPSGWAVAGTVLVVYAGVLLTFFALLAGAGDVGAAVDPAEVMLWW